jgi:hypothetical protein
MAEMTTQNVGPDDVLLGRGGATNNHAGNHRFRQCVAARQAEYLNCRKHEKVNIAKSIVAEIQSRGGRFLRCGTIKDHWDEVSDKRAQEKTSQALREGLDVRNNKIRPNKQIKTVRADSSPNDNDAIPGDGIFVTTRMSPSNKSASTEHIRFVGIHALDMPTLKDESSGQSFLSYQLPSISKQEPKYSCEV